MIPIDFSSMCHAGLWALREEVQDCVATDNLDEIPNILRHGVLSQFRTVRSKFGREYGESVVCCDSRIGYWRTDIFPHYKARRKLRKHKSEMPWDVITPFFHQLRDEIRENFPYRVIEIPKLEADDVIAILVEDVANKNVRTVGVEDDEPEPVLMYGRDKDGRQLLKYPNVRQYDPQEQKFIRLEESPKKFLKRLIITGDAGDDICNIFSPSDSFVKGIRQKPATAKKVDALLSSTDIFEACENDDIRQRLMENTRLISFDCIPKKFRPMVVDAYQEKPRGTKLKAFEYLGKHNCKLLMEDIDRF